MHNGMTPFRPPADRAALLSRLRIRGVVYLTTVGGGVMSLPFFLPCFYTAPLPRRRQKVNTAASGARG